MIKPTDIKALEGFRIWVRFSDGVEGEVDLSHLRKLGGVFESWDERAAFENTRISESGNYLWVGELDLCPDPLYQEITGITIPEAEIRSRQQMTHA